jgi:hypothetical protein
MNEMEIADGKRQSRKSVEVTVCAVAFCALSMVIGGTFLGAPWPAAIAACALSAMGAVVGYFQLKSA